MVHQQNGKDYHHLDFFVRLISFRSMAGLMGVTAFLSMWINNSAAASIMLPVALAITDELQNHSKTFQQKKNEIKQATAAVNGREKLNQTIQNSDIRSRCIGSNANRRRNNRRNDHQYFTDRRTVGKDEDKVHCFLFHRKPIIPTISKKRFHLLGKNSKQLTLIVIPHEKKYESIRKGDFQIRWISFSPSFVFQVFYSLLLIQQLLVVYRV